MIILTLLTIAIVAYSFIKLISDLDKKTKNKLLFDQEILNKIESSDGLCCKINPSYKIKTRNSLLGPQFSPVIECQCNAAIFNDEVHRIRNEKDNPINYFWNTLEDRCILKLVKRINEKI
jgi:hypothetical protein